MTLFFFDNPKINGLFNIGTGTARSWNEVAASLFQALGRPLNIEYIPMPDKLKEKYQYYTCANMTKLRSAGCSHTCTGLNAAVKEYVRNYLQPNKCLIIEFEPGLEDLLLTKNTDQPDFIPLQFHDINTFQDLFFLAVFQNKSMGFTHGKPPRCNDAIELVEGL
jgi:hypothetical protein